MRLIGRIKNSKLYKDNRGSAMIVAIVVSIIVIAFTLSLLLVSYSLFSSSVKKVTQSQVKELAKSISIELGEEITSPRFDDMDALKAGIQGTGDYKSSDYNLWYYLRYNVFQGSKWPYYGDATIAGHIEANAFRYFDVDILGGDEAKYAAMADEITVCMYWSPEDVAEKSGVVLTVEVMVKKGDQSYNITSYYELSAETFDGAESVSDDTQSNAFNPDGNSIDLSEDWKWTKVN